MSASYVEFSSEETARGVRYAREKYGQDISHDLLRVLADRTRGLMEREFLSFRDACYQVLNGAKLFSKTAAQKAKRDAYKGAIAKMHNWRKQFKKTGKAPEPTLPPHVSENKSGQLEFILS